MKAYKLFVSFLVVMLFLTGIEKIYAQEEVFSALDGQLTADETKQFTKAKDLVKKAQDMQKQIAEQDKKTEKFFTKNKQKKGERKSADAKKLRIDAAKYFQQAYDIVNSVYQARMKSCNFIYSEDEQMAANLKTQSEESFKNAEAKLKPYKTMAANNLKKVEYAKLKNDLALSTSLRVDALKDQSDAILLCLSQSDKKKKNEATEMKSWQNATKENSINAYSSYLDGFPNGKYASEAREKIKELNDIAQKNAEAEKERLKKNDKGLVYKVQIAAAKVQLNQKDLLKIFPNQSEVNMRQADGYYKYSVGSFKTYAEAKKYQKNLRIRGSFVTSFNEGNQINIKQAKQLETKK